MVTAFFVVEKKKIRSREEENDDQYSLGSSLVYALAKSEMVYCVPSFEDSKMQDL